MTELTTPDLRIFTDGSCIRNPGPGGFGVIVVDGEKTQEISRGFQLTTNNRMELMAVICAMELALEQYPAAMRKITIYSDSQYTVNAINQGWLESWVIKDFRKVKNPDLWKRFRNVYNQGVFELVWVKGHAGNVLNEHCDRLAFAAATSNNQGTDEGYAQIIAAAG